MRIVLTMLVATVLTLGLMGCDDKKAGKDAAAAGTGTAAAAAGTSTAAAADSAEGGW